MTSVVDQLASSAFRHHKKLQKQYNLVKQTRRRPVMCVMVHGPSLIE